MTQVMYNHGFYTVENDGQRDFRWMQCEAQITLPYGDDGKWLCFTCGNPHGKPVTLGISGTRQKQHVLEPGWTTSWVNVDDVCPKSDGVLHLNCKEKLDVPGDGRELCLMLGEIKREMPENGVILLDGFYDEESDNLRTFRWMHNKAMVHITGARPSEWLLFYVKSPSAWAEPLCIRNLASHNEFLVHVLPGEWKVVGWPVEEIGEEGVYELSTSYTLENQNEEDTRVLSFMISGMNVTKPTEYERNSALMHSEVLSTIQTKSIGTFLSCDTCSECNLRCAMCILDKKLRDETKTKGVCKIKHCIEQLLQLSSKVQPYITGEPFFGKDIWVVLEMAERISKNRTIEIEISTNGLCLNKSNVDKLLNSCVTSLLISVNAATVKTYNNLCGGDFLKLIKNIKYLSNNKNKNKKLNISLSYILMRENMDEVAQFIQLSKKLNIDNIQIWTLNNLANDIEDRIMNDNFTFIYKQQQTKYYPNLTKNKLRQIELLAKELNINIGITPGYRFEIGGHNDISYPLSKEEFTSAIDKFEADNKENNAKCSKRCYFPWYLFCCTTEGLFAPCVHLLYKGGIDNIINKNIADVWNSDAMKHLRETIISGNIPYLCKDTQCPFV